ncbi:hypothetical protein A0H81_10175 [Grifola frondosa]|uniref:DUF6533 domain-containing protein n=1 Tax=Grifola frondosa TaxID=5627 RepID=A0A1C7LYI8_GRIFR|nr:hypothetical protein A0H81_10175 [Grifola frondosa]
MSDTQALFAAYDRLVVENYFIVASSAVLFFDFCLTFTSEVQCVWSRKRFSYTTLIFFLNRYTVLVERVVLLIEILLQTDINEVLYLFADSHTY